MSSIASIFPQPTLLDMILQILLVSFPLLLLVAILILLILIYRKM